ncbi:hypothetical protein JW935_25770 [candidate division KSB1 bacterium]|nr:hypothetical protein [candidate division KSB1 bacterium]
MISRHHFSTDILEFLEILFQYKVKYLIIGGEAVIYYGFARLTGDIDLFYDRCTENTGRLYESLLQFWDHSIPGLSDKEELLERDAVFQFGVPPHRLDLLGDVEKIAFNDA